MGLGWQLTESSAGTLSLLFAPDPAYHHCIQHTPRTHSCNASSRGLYMVSKNLQAIEALEICWSTDEAILSLRKFCEGCQNANGVTEPITEGLSLEETFASHIVQCLCSSRFCSTAGCPGLCPKGFSKCGDSAISRGNLYLSDIK